MKKGLTINLFAVVLLLLLTCSNSWSTNFTWSGTSDNAWNTSTNWSPNGIPDSVDNVTIVSSANSPTLSEERKVNNFTMTSGMLNLGGYQLIIKGTGNFNGGTIENGTVKPVGLLGHFGGTYFNATVNARCGYFHMNGGQFDLPVVLEDTGYASTSGTGGCIFNDSLTIIHYGTFYFNMATTNGDDFNGPVTLINFSTHEINIASSDSSWFNDNIVVNSTNSGGIFFGITDGVSFLASGKTLSVGSVGFTNDYITLKRFRQLGSTSQTVSLTGTAAVNFIDCIFNGNLSLSAAGFLLRNSIFNGTSSFTKNGTANYQSDGGNYFYSDITISNNGSAGRIRMATTTADTYVGNAIFNSTGQDVQIAYLGDNRFEGNLTVNSNKVVFNTSNGRVLMTGSTDQELNGSYNFTFKKLTINKLTGMVYANTTLSVDDTLNLISGYLSTTGTNLLTMKSASKVVGTGNNSFVSGPVKKVGNTGFVFPIGKDYRYRPIEISAPSTSSSEFTGEFMNDSVLVNTGQRDTTLGYINRLKYWKLSRNSGTSQIYVTLSWDSLNALADTFISVCSWNGTQWKDLGKGIINGSTVAGNLKSTSVATSYMEFTLGYKSNNSLPTPWNCNSVSSATTLQGCIMHASSPAIITITGDIFLQDQGPLGFFHLPWPLSSGTTLTSLVSGISPKWWEQNCPTVYTDYTNIYHVGNSMYPLREGAFFAVEPGVTIQNLRFRGAQCDYKDFNNGHVLCTGFYVESNTTADAVTFNNCEIACFSNAGIWKTDLAAELNINNCYIHTVKGRSYAGIGYGTWLMGDIQDTPPLIEISINNSVFDDCKAAIDGQGDPMNWIINDCTFSQFFISEDINKHNSNLFKMYDANDDIPFDYHYCYTNTSCGSNCFYGPYCITALSCTTLTNTSVSYAAGFNVCNPTPVYDVGGGDTRIINSIFHKKWKIDTNGNITLPLPNWDETPTRYGNSDFEIELSQNTFATELFDPAVMNQQYNNRGGYARIADNYIEACVWDGELKFIKSNNSFSYKPGIPVATSAVQPFELLLDLKSGGVPMPKSYTPSPYPSQKYIQYINKNSSFTANYTISNPVSGIDEYFIVRPNPNEGSGITGTNIISNENYFYNLEEITSSNSISISYDKPGLYGIDVLGFDAQNHATPPAEEFRFKASSWQHIPVIVKDDSEEQVLYFNIKDSYQTDISLEVYKEARLNDEVIWKEKISDGGAGWEYVRVDLDGYIWGSTTTTIKSLIHTDGTLNILSFNVCFEDNSTTTADLPGLYVWVDDVYIKKYNSPTGDNLVKDGSIEFAGNSGICSTPTADCYWFKNGTVSYSCTISGNTSNPYADGNLSSIERKSGMYSLVIQVPRLEECNSPSNYPASATDPTASIGTVIDFTDLLSCDDYDVAVDLISNSITGNHTYTNQVIRIGENITIGISKSLTLQGCLVLFETDATPYAISVYNGGKLTLTRNGTTPTHIFGCRNMWGGIVNNSGEIDINTGSGTVAPTILEDASTAIQSTEGIVNIRYAVFNNNHVGIELIDYDQTPLNTSNDEGFLGIDFKSTDSLLTKAPHAGEPAFAHFNLENVVNVSIGGFGGTGSTPPAYKNRLADAVYGILSVNSNALIFNNEFENIRSKETTCRNCEGAINARGGILEIGGLISGTGSNPYFKNAFSNCSFGIVSQGETTLLVQGNTFAENLAGIICEKNSNSDIRIDAENQFLEVNNGIIVRNFEGTLVISENSFNDLGYIPIDPLDFINTGISIQNYFNNPLNDIRISGNTFSDCRIGIHARKVPNISIGADLNGGSGNTLTFNKEKGGYHHGIWIEDSQGAKIQENIITQTGEGFNVEGITVYKSTDVLINKNEIYQVAIPVHVFDLCDGTEFHCNIIDNSAVSGQGIQMNLATLPPQGTTVETWDNKWFGYDITVNGITGVANSLFDWYFQDTDPEYEPFPGPSTASPVALTTFTPDDCVVLLAMEEPDRDERYGLTVKDSLLFTDYQHEFRYKSRQHLFESLKFDTSLFTRNVPSDTLYRNFFNDLSLTNVSEFHKVDSLIGISELNEALEVNDAINDTIEIETNLKNVKDILMSTLLCDTLLSNSDSTIINNIANQSTLIGGNSVYDARAILFLEVNEQIAESKLIPQFNTVKNTLGYKSGIKLFPNPATAQCFVYFENIINDFTLDVFDNAIRKVYSNQFSAQTRQHEFSVEGYRPGLYLLLINESNGTVHKIKFIINKF